MNSFREALKKRVMFIDGAMGTQIHAADLQLDRDYLGLENCCEVINLTRREVIRDIQIYQRFFAKLSKAVFLEAHTI